MTRAAVYARYSSDNQSEASIEDQIRLCQERAERDGHEVCKSYTDHAVSGASLLRPGIQELMRDALAGKFEIILAEALDRLSRDQEDIAGFYKRMRFAGVRIVTLSEGEISDLHIGLKGTMNALFLQDLADKTRRGLRGRVEVGKSGGGNSYGYDVIHKLGDDGTLVRGDRRINGEEAAIVRRVFNEYAAGHSPRSIAKRLNREGIAAPSGKGWGPSTIHGNRKRGTGILNNELYVGRLVWNRLRYVKDPDTGKRISRLNPESEWITQDVPELRIVDQDLWDRVKARQNEMEAAAFGQTNAGHIDRRLPAHLFSGLMRCGVCGGGMVNLSSVRVGCANARNKGTCGNKLTMRREDLERTVLEALQHQLMDPALCEAFASEYARHLNRLRMERNAGLKGARAELDKVTRETDRLVQALLDGVPASQVRDRMVQLEKRKGELEARLGQPDEAPILIHPNMAAFYREQVAGLREALIDEGGRAEASALIRTLIERIELAPVEHDGRRTLAITLHGHLAGILALAAKKQKPPRKSGSASESLAMVAGARNHRYRHSIEVVI